MIPTHPNMPPNRPQEVSLSKDSRKEIVDALRDIRKSLQEDEREHTTFSDKLADSLTSGKGFVKSLSEALAHESAKETAKLKKAFDPLEIVKRITGGSRLATVMAGKALGHSNESLRAKLGYKTHGPEQIFSPREESSPVASRMAPDESLSLLEQMAKSMSLITLRVSEIAHKLGATKRTTLTSEGRLRDAVSGKFMSKEEAQSLATQTILLKSIRDSLINIRKDDQERDDKAEDRRRSDQFKQEFSGRPSAIRPTQITAAGTVAPTGKSKVEEEAGGFFSNLMGSFEKLSGVIGTFSLALGTVLAPIGTFKNMITGAAKGIETTIESFKFFSSGEKVAEALQKTKDVAKGGIDLAGKGIAAAANIGKKLLGKKTEETALKAGTQAAGALAKTATEAAEKETTKVAAITAEKAAAPVAKAAAQTTTKIAAKPTLVKIGKDKIEKILAKELPKAFGGSTLGRLLPGIGAALGLGFAVSRLIKGDYTGAGLEAVSGLGGAVTAIPATVASLIRDVYQEAYGVFPEKDPLRGERFPELAEMVQDSASKWLKEKASTFGVANAQAAPTKKAEMPATITPESQRTTEAPPLPNKTAAALAENVITQKELATSPTAGAVPTPSIHVNNINNARSTAAFIPQLPSPRSQDSSYLRALDQNYAP